MGPAAAQASFVYYLSGADDDDADGVAGERLNVRDAGDIWLSNGMDEGYMFGYAEEEPRRAAGQ